MNDTANSNLAPQGSANPAYNASAAPGTAGSLDPTIAPPGQTQSATDINSQISGNTAGVVFPQAPGAPTKGPSDNTSVPNPIPTAADIVSQGTSTTPAESTNTSLLQKVAALIGQKQGQTELTNTSEAKAGVPALSKTVQDLNTQLEGLNNQAADLSNRINYTVPNQEQVNAEGRGITAGGLAPIQASDIRKLQIQQGAIASQALTLKSAIYGAQGQLTLAKDAADKAATAQYEHQQIEIDHMNALIDANKPQMTKQEKAQADLVQENLKDRQTQINNAQEDKKTIIALATAAMKFFPNDSAAHYAAQQALAESNKPQPDLQKAFDLVGKYQQDPIATNKALLELAQIRKTNAAIDQASAITSANNTDIPTTISGITNKNQPNPKLGGLTVNGLTQKAQVYLTNGGNIQGLGLSNSGASGIQRTLIANYAGYLADQMGMTVPQITAAYKANSKAATQVIERAARIDTTASTLSSQFPRLSQLATKVGGLGITESDLAAGKAAFTRKFGSTDAANYFDLIQTVRSDYASMQAAVAGGRGGQYFAQNAAEAIPVGLSPDQYTGIGQTIAQSAALAKQASGQEAQALIGGSSSPGAGTGSTQTVSLKDPKTGAVKSFTLSPQDLQEALNQGFLQQ